MSWSDQDIDKLFQQAKQPETPPFEESFWTEMEALLPEQKRKKVAVWWWTGGAAMLAIAISAGFFMVGSDANQSVVRHAKTSNNDDAVKPVTKTDALVDFSKVSGRYVEPQVASETDGIAQNTTTGVYYPEVVGVEEIVSSEKMNSGREVLSSSVGDKPLVELPKLSLSFVPVIFHPEMPEKPEYKPTRFYMQAGAGIGLSSRKNVPQGANYLHCYSIGGGLYKKMDNVILTFGIQGRVDFVRNIRYTYFPDGTATKRIDADYRQLYSVELPASIGVMNGRNSFAFTVNAGFQAGVFGELKETNNEVVVRSENTFVRVDKKATTLTMELGCSYLRTIAPDWYLGAGVNADIIEPFNGSSYAGEQRLLPLNTQILLRRTF